MSSSSFTIPHFFSSEALGEQPTHKRTWQAIPLFVAVLVLPQLSSLLWWMQSRSSIHFRGYINAEYLTLLAVALIFPNWLSISLVTLELTVSLVEPIAHLYYFSPGDALASLKYLSFIPHHLLILYGFLLVCYVLACFRVTKYIVSTLSKTHGKLLAVLFLFFGAAPLVVDFSHGRLRPFHVSPEDGDVDLHSVRLTRAPGASLLYATLILNQANEVASSEPAPISSALDRAIASIPARSNPNIVLVLTESWGRSLKGSINQAETAPYLDPELTEMYDVHMGTVPFFGPTTHGETRELCGDSRGRPGPANASAAKYDSCWPGRLSHNGYRAVAVHGFSPTMFERASWYRQLGFSETAFLPELQQSGAAMCDGAFPGACDADVAKWIGNRLEKEGTGPPLFVHWVTLNSHLPVADVPGVEAQSGCRRAGIDGAASLCAWFNRVLMVHESVREVALRRDNRPTVFVIVGDHAPPFLDPAIRRQFSQSEVPWVILTPRTLTNSPTPNMLVAGAGAVSQSTHEHLKHIANSAPGRPTHRHCRREKVTEGSKAVV